MSAAALPSLPDPGLPAGEQAGAQHAQGIPRQAREGLMRAWLEILHERHPGVTWIPVEALERNEEHGERLPSAPAALALLRKSKDAGRARAG